MAFESLSRPFTMPTSPAANRFVISSLPEDPEEAILEWEATTSAETVQATMSEGDPQCEGGQEETCRRETEKRIENPDDPDQYVNVKTTDSITFTDKIANKNTTYTLNNSDTGSDFCPQKPEEGEDDRACAQPVFKHNTWWSGHCNPPCQEENEIPASLIGAF